MRKVERAVVTGVTSFIGSSVAQNLLNQGCHVYGLVRPESRAKDKLPIHPNFHVVTAGLTDTSIWIEQIKTADTLFHFAWGGPGAEGRADTKIQNQNVEDTLTCLRNAAKIGVTRFLFSGSQAEYGKVSGKITEETPCDPILEYGKCKLKVRQQAPILAKELGIEYIHTRIFSVYGPGDHPYTLIPSCIRTFLAGETMALSSCEQMWNFLHIDDASDIFFKLAQCDMPDSSPVVNVAGSDTRVLRAYVDEIHRLCGRTGICSYGARQGGEKPVDNWPVIEKLQSMTDWTEKVSFEEGISNLIHLEQEKGVQRL